ncbi:MAG: Trp family transcriptional regulator [Patescibacteria group bacterium]
MSKVEPRKLSPRELQAMQKELEVFLLRLPRRKDIVTLFNVLLTHSERIMVIRRLRIAHGLLLGKTYLEIRAEHGVGIDTIRTVHQLLEGQLANYRTVLSDVLAKASEEGEKKKRVGRISLDPTSFRALRKRYPAEFLFFNLLLGDPDMYEVEL